MQKGRIGYQMISNTVVFKALSLALSLSLSLSLSNTNTKIYWRMQSYCESMRESQSLHGNGTAGADV